MGNVPAPPSPFPELLARHLPRWLPHWLVRVRPSARISQAALVSCGAHALALLALALAAAPVARDVVLFSGDGSSTTVLTLAPLESPDPAPEPAPAPPPAPAPQTTPEPAPQPAPAPIAEGPRDELGAPTRNVPQRSTMIQDAGQGTSEGTGTTPAPPAPPAEPVRVPKASFAGVEASPARRVVYLIDGSGSMVSSLSFVRAELARSVGRLREDQQFQVIVFRQPAAPGDQTLRYFHAPSGFPALTPASPQTHAEVRDWVQTVTVSGRSDPLTGLEAAMALEPDLIFLLTRNIARSGVNVEERTSEVLRALDRLNPQTITGGRRVKILTIQFLDDDPTGLMQQIADAHGAGPGSYRVVSRDELRRE